MTLATTTEMHAGKSLRVARVGDGGAETLVCLHGYPDNLQIFSRLAPLLATSCRRVIAFDWPGMGESDAWQGGTTPRHMARRLVSLLDAWRLARVDVVGMDMGGQPALVFAAEHPDRIGRLVVMNSLVSPDERTSWEIAVLRRFRWNRLILRALPRVVFARAKRTFLPDGALLTPEVERDMWQSFARQHVRAFITRLCAGYDAALPRLPETYGRVRCPTLALWAERDRHFPPAHAHRLVAALPRGRTEIIPGAEHWMAFYLADEVAARIAAFLAEQPSHLPV